VPSVKGNACIYCLNCTKFGQLILRKITKIIATRCQILRLKCIKFHFDWGSAPDHAGGSLQRSRPQTTAGFKGAASRQGVERDGDRERREEMGREEKERREGMEEGRGKVTEGMAGTGYGMGRRGEGKGGGATAPKLQFLAPPLVTVMT